MPCDCLSDVSVGNGVRGHCQRHSNLSPWVSAQEPPTAAMQLETSYLLKMQISVSEKRCHFEKKLKGLIVGESLRSSGSGNPAP